MSSTLKPQAPTKKDFKDLRKSILQPALTSNFECSFFPPIGVSKWAVKKEGDKSGARNNTELFTLLCSEASLPGSSLSTIDIDNDYHGVSQKNVYRRAYDDRADFTFYVDGIGPNPYSVIQFFENWISYTVNEQVANGLYTPTYSYRVQYPDDYKGDIYITKFERNFSSAQKSLQYRFFRAFPISINSMPVSYDQSQLLKCTVSFSYERYFMTTDIVRGSVGIGDNQEEPRANTATGVSNIQPQTVELFGVTLDPNRPTLAQFNE